MAKGINNKMDHQSKGRQDHVGLNTVKSDGQRECAGNIYMCFPNCLLGLTSKRQVDAGDIMGLPFCKQLGGLLTGFKSLTSYRV